MFWTSSFIGHSTHKDILENFESCVEWPKYFWMAQGLM